MNSNNAGNTPSGCPDFQAFTQLPFDKAKKIVDALASAYPFLMISPAGRLPPLKQLGRKVGWCEALWTSL